MFNYGRKYYSDRACRLDDEEHEELIKCYQHYQLKYWGYVDSEIWRKNNESALSENGGRIEAKYLTESGTVITVIRLEDCSYSLFLTNEDIEEGYEAKFLARIEEERKALNERLQRSSPRRSSSSSASYNFPSFLSNNG